MLKKNEIVILCLILAAIGAATFFTRPRAIGIPKEVEIARENPFDKVSIAAKSAIVYIPDKGEVAYAKDPYTSRPIASVTKLITAYVSSKFLFPNDTVMIDETDLIPEGDIGLRPGESWRAKDIRDAMLITSSNDAAEAIGRSSSKIFTERLATTTSYINYTNSYLGSKGLSSLYVESYSGLDRDVNTPTVRGNAFDIARLIELMLRESPDILDATRHASVVRSPIGGPLHTFRNTNITVDQIPNILGSKTGYTQSAGGNVAFVFSVGLGSPVIIVILGSTDQNTRFDDAMKLVKATEELLGNIDFNKPQLDL